MRHVQLIITLSGIFWIAGLVDVVLIVNINNTTSTNYILTIFGILNGILIFLFFTILYLFIKFLINIGQSNIKKIHNTEDPIPLIILDKCENIKLFMFNNKYIGICISNKYDYPIDWLAIAVCEMQNNNKITIELEK